ncbi:DUF3601 domain-containing protein [Hymenobacter cheonanensis]|uniref:DUF3601 domain-containing protein n=1 Tax=Hymenobacter sp. CA2-7 TaxID=3063993 RepID=UPI0027124F90|nr:DUF3601 domain-containing protein [Hymenobacter sp. CA2-7]MDO7887284.1 DUF3601 domain-containing protein [Hymenobacter sp. CA2-7]
MASIHALVRGQRYQIMREFVDYDGGLHSVGETWLFEGTTFVPYDDELTLHVRAHGVPRAYRLQWRPEEQEAIIENFTDFITAC